MLRRMRPIVGEQPQRDAVLKSPQLLAHQPQPARGIGTDESPSNLVTMVHQPRVTGPRKRERWLAIVAVAQANLGESTFRTRMIRKREVERALEGHQRPGRQRLRNGFPFALEERAHIGFIHHLQSGLPGLRAQEREVALARERRQAIHERLRGGRPRRLRHRVRQRWGLRVEPLSRGVRAQRPWRTHRNGRKQHPQRLRGDAPSCHAPAPHLPRGHCAQHLHQQQMLGAKQHGRAVQHTKHHAQFPVGSIHPRQRGTGDAHHQQRVGRLVVQ